MATASLRAVLCSLPLTRATTTPSEEGRRRSHGAVLTFGTLNLAIEEAHTPSGLKRTRELNGKLLMQLALNHVEEKAARRRHFASPCLASTLFSSAARAGLYVDASLGLIRVSLSTGSATRLARSCDRPLEHFQHVPLQTTGGRERGDHVMAPHLCGQASAWKVSHPDVGVR